MTVASPYLQLYHVGRQLLDNRPIDGCVDVLVEHEADVENESIPLVLDIVDDDRAPHKFHAKSGSGEQNNMQNS